MASDGHLWKPKTHSGVLHICRLSIQHGTNYSTKDAKRQRRHCTIDRTCIQYSSTCFSSSFLSQPGKQPRMLTNQSTKLTKLQTCKDMEQKKVKQWGTWYCSPSLGKLQGTTVQTKMTYFCWVTGFHVFVRPFQPIEGECIQIVHLV